MKITKRARTMKCSNQTMVYINLKMTYGPVSCVSHVGIDTRPITHEQQKTEAIKKFRKLSHCFAILHSSLRYLSRGFSFHHDR